jgi:hypothetical protein
VYRTPGETHGFIYEVNARLLLARLRAHDPGLTLGTLAPGEFEQWARAGYDLVWLMGVWCRSAGARREALAHPDLQAAYSAVLGHWTPDDVAGSPYAIADYAVDPALGKNQDLRRVREEAHRAGLGLIVDFVPNHVALDHPWTRAHPDWFVKGTSDDVDVYPELFFRSATGVHLAYGKDPYFPPWTDTAQVNFFSRDMRRALIEQLLAIARVADGVRCDMAMLGLNDVFEGVWGPFVRTRRPAEEFWTEAIGRVKHEHPDFLFIAETYWSLEPKLLSLGFDFVYDKAFYDLLRQGAAGDVVRYLQACPVEHRRAVRFIENHDEPRAAAVFGPARSRAAAVAIATLPGLCLIHDGQAEGRRHRVPVQLVREPAEEPDAEMKTSYDRLLGACREIAFHDATWMLGHAGPASDDDDSYRQLVSWSWSGARQLCIVAVNYSGAPARGRLKIVLPAWLPGTVVARDILNGPAYSYDRAELDAQGLYVALEPWNSHVLVVP